MIKSNKNNRLHDRFHNIDDQILRFILIGFLAVLALHSLARETTPLILLDYEIFVIQDSLFTSPIFT